MTIKRLVCEQAAMVEARLQKAFNKRFDELAQELKAQTEKIVSTNCGKIATDLRIRLK